MKTFTAILIYSMIFFNAFSQTKILFDATKAEMGNNADWIIDADKHNIGYDPDAYIGGNESNPQQIPTPAQSGITSSTSESYWTGALSAWAIDAVKLGYYVETLPYDGSITYGNTSNPQDLTNYDIFVVCEPNILFSSSEKTALLNFVQNGGGLFMIADHNNSDRNGDGYDSPHIWNDFFENNSIENNPFGISFDYEYFTETTYNMANDANDPLLHGNYGNVTSVEFYGGTSITINPNINPSVKGAVYRSDYSNTGNTGIMVAYATYGNGKVVAVGDSSPADDGSGDNNDNLYDGWIEDANGNHERLFMNATIWLAEKNTELVRNCQNAKISTIINNNSVFITINENNVNTYKLNIYSISGTKIFSANKIFSNQKIQIQLPNSGIYIYQISNKTDNFYGKFSFIKQ
jgi:hypothetical protein